MPVTPGLHGQRFVVTLDGRRHATSLLVALVFIEVSDVVFAIDSVPAIFAITREPLIVFTSNICAILGLRAMGTSCLPVLCSASGKRKTHWRSSSSSSA
jgi:tellurite resistance protein TerC